MRAVLRKELREIFRDRRTLFSVIISPLLLTPMMMGLIGGVIQKQMSQARVETYAVGLVGASGAPSVQRLIGAGAQLRIEAVTRAEAERRIKDRRLRAAAVLPADAELRFQQQRSVPVTILLDAGNDTSRRAAERLKAFFAERGEQVVASRLQRHGLAAEMAAPFPVTEQRIDGGGAGTLMLSMFLPYVLALSAFIGSLYAANDLVAGEKERGTLETLLVSPATRRDLVLGKFLAVAGLSLIGSLLSVIGILLPFVVPLKVFDWMAQGGLTLTPAAVLVMLVMQVPLAVLGAGVLLAISTYARNQKEAQSYLGPVLLLVSVAAMLSMLMRAEASWLLAFVPILNAALIVKQAITRVFDPLFIGIAFTASIGYAALALVVATRLFEKESVLLKA
jgi:sodium transport system permease protein